MKLLMLTHYFASHRGGIEIVAEQLSGALADTGPADIVWAASDSEAPPRDFPGKCIGLGCSNLVERVLGIPWPIPMPNAFRILSALIKDADLILLHDALYPINIAAFLFAQRYGKRVMIVQHVGHVPYRSVLLRFTMRIANRLIAVPMLSHADRVVFISGLTAEYFAQRCTFRHPPAVIFNGIANTMVEAAMREAATSPRTDSHQATVAFVGRFVEKKGLSVLQKLAHALPDIRFVLAGWGSIRPEDWKAANVSIHRNLQNAELIDIYRSADMLVLPSVGEGFPLVVQEALCCGVPVLCSEEILHADPWLRGRIEVAPVDLANIEATAAVWAERISGLISGQLAMPRVEPREAVARYAWPRSAAAYWALFDEMTTRQSALIT